MSSSAISRFWAVILTFVLGYYFIVEPARQFWCNYWLLKDGQQGVALVTKKHWAGHNVVVYTYRVKQHTYSGQDFRSWQNPKYAHVNVGEETVCYFSLSHPWLSAINLPRSAMVEGLPVLILVWLILAGLVIATINPNSRWALNPSRTRASGTNERTAVGER